MRLTILEYLLTSSQEFRDLSRGRQITQIIEDLGWCDSSILTVARALSFWQSAVRVAPASPGVEAGRLRKTRSNSAKAADSKRREGESLSEYQRRVLAELPEDLQELAQTQLGTENQNETEQVDASQSPRRQPAA